MFEKILENIKNHDSIVIFGHLNPDGDCYGSQMALRESLSIAFPNKKIYAVGTGCRRYQKMLGKMDEVSDEIINNSLAFLVDSNDFSRSEDKRISSAKAWIKIDHHVDVGSFTAGDFVVMEDACSTCEIIVDMIRELKLPITSKVASALYLGILTDTGRFQYISDYAKIFEQAAWLVQNGANPKELNRLLNITEEASMAFKGFVYSNYKKTEAGTIYLAINQETLKRFDIPANKASNMVNLISNINGFPIWAFFCEEPNGNTHVEFRSNGPAVQPIALKCGGGGHLQAAGATIPEFNDKIISDIVKMCDEAIINYKKDHE